MVVAEVRDLVNRYSEADLRLLIVELYKTIPKKLREEKNIDKMFQDIHGYQKAGKYKKTTDVTVAVCDLKPEIDQFLEYAYHQYYFAPNNYVHKKERPKWRFTVKRYIKDLQGVGIDGPGGEIATGLLRNLYEMLCYACKYYIFNTNDPFGSVGIVRADMLDNIIARKLARGINGQALKWVVELVVNNCTGSELFHSELSGVLIKNLKSADARELAIEQCKELKKAVLQSALLNKKQKWARQSLDYETELKINHLVKIVFRLQVALCENDEAVAYFSKNYQDDNPESKLSELLRLLFEYDLFKHWASEYERAVNAGIRPNEELQKMYKHLQDNGRLPDCFSIL
jgi:hypothetical protein